VWLFVCT